MHGAEMEQLGDGAKPLETGGIPLGCIDAGGDPMVTNVIGPDPEATHRGFPFVPDHEWQDLGVAAHSTNFNRTQVGIDTVRWAQVKRCGVGL